MSTWVYFQLHFSLIKTLPHQILGKWDQELTIVFNRLPIILCTSHLCVEKMKGYIRRYRRHSGGGRVWFIKGQLFPFFFLFLLFRAALVAYGGSQARGWIKAAAASLHHSHSIFRAIAMSDLSQVLNPLSQSQGLNFHPHGCQSDSFPQSTMRTSSGRFLWCQDPIWE